MLKKQSIVVILSIAMLLAAASVIQAAPTNLTFWFYVGGPNLENIKALVDEFNQQHPSINVTVEYTPDWFQKALTAYVGGSPPDIVWCAWYNVGDFASRGALVNLEDRYLRPSGLYNEYAEDFYPYLWETSKYNDRIYAIPFDTNNMITFYNVDMFDSAGIEAPADDWTWSGFLDVAKKLSQRDQWGYSGGWADRHFYDFTMSAGGQGFFSADGKEVYVDSPEAVRALEFLTDLTHKHHAAPWPLVPKAFEYGKAAMEIQGSYRIPVYREQTKINFGVAPQPQDKVRFSSAGGESLIMFKTNGKREDAAWTFIEWMTSSEVLAKWSVMSGYLPVRQSSANHPDYLATLQNDPIRMKFVNELQYGGRYPAVPGYAEFMNIVNKSLDEARHQAKTPADALSDAAKKGKPVLQEASNRE